MIRALVANGGPVGIEKLFEPFVCKSLRLKNRFVMAPMSRYSCPGAVPNEELVAYFSRRAQSEVGLVLTGGAAINRPAGNHSPNLADFRPICYPMWKRCVDAVHDAGGSIALQLWHAGAWFDHDWTYRPAPLESPSGLCAPGRVVGEPMSEEAISDVIAEYGRAATAAKLLGFDAIEVHAAHGYLLDQFFWHKTNRRTDQWGGSELAERARFPAAVVRAVRRSVGPDMPISVRISQWKEQGYLERMAESPDELHAWLRPLLDAGADLFHCSQRRWWQPEFDGSTLNFAGWVKKVTETPTITVGSVGLDVEVMSFFKGSVARPQAIDALADRMENGEFDLVAVGRALIADPQWVLNVIDGSYLTLEPFDKSAESVVF